MSSVVVIGASLKLLGWALAGAELIEASDADEARAAWSGLDADVGLVLLTAEARSALPAHLEGAMLWAVLPS